MIKTKRTKSKKLNVNDVNKTFSNTLKKLNKLEYPDYLKSEHWIHFKNEAYKWANNRCQLCNKEKVTLNVHHKTYETKGRETFNDVIVLCHSCHEKHHSKDENYVIENSKPSIKVTLYSRLWLRFDSAYLADVESILREVDVKHGHAIYYYDLNTKECSESKYCIDLDTANLGNLVDYLGDENVKIVPE